MKRRDKMVKLVDIYAKALGVLDAFLGKDKDQVYSACQTIQTVGREIQSLERIMRLVGDLTLEDSTYISNDEVEAHGGFGDMEEKVIRHEIRMPN